MIHRAFRRLIWVGFLVFLGVLAAAASAAPETPARPGLGLLREIAEKVYPAELVMRHAGDLALDDAQREAITTEIQALQTDLVPLQWEIYEAGEKLTELLAPARVDEQAVLAQAARVMALEQSIKTRHLTMLVRVKNLLTGEQQEILDGHRVLPRSGELRERIRERVERRLEREAER
jgi:Spy/CpxP family protein refolding chaperone